ncbi:MAG: hypothetical protein FWF37_01440 [Chloroflexi bacterium]|nr:hypothetical protein [Chloroflexota bacterium]
MNIMSKEEKRVSANEAGSGWNWGALLIPAFWGPGNGQWWAVLLLAPFIIGASNFLSSNDEWFVSAAFYLMMIAYIVIVTVLGFFGNRMAWSGGKQSSVEQFKLNQLKWAKYGFLACFLGWLLWYCLIIGNMIAGVIFNSSVTEVYAFGPMSGTIATIALGLLLYGFVYYNKKVKSYAQEIKSSKMQNEDALSSDTLINS